MKPMIHSLLVLISLSTQALAGALPTETDSWNEILSRKNVIVKAPSIRLSSKYGSIDYSVFAIHQKGDELFLKSGDTTTVCLDNTSYKYRNKGGSTCRFQEEVALSSPITFTKSVCTKFSKSKNDGNRCLASVDRTITIPTRYEIGVYEYFPSFVGKNQPRIGGKLFVKEYEIPKADASPL